MLIDTRGNKDRFNTRQHKHTRGVRAVTEICMMWSTSDIQLKWSQNHNYHGDAWKQETRVLTAGVGLLDTRGPLCRPGDQDSWRRSAKRWLLPAGLQVCSVAEIFPSTWSNVSLSSFATKKKCFMFLTITLRVMRGGLMLHFCLILQQHETKHHHAPQHELKFW